MLCNKCNKNIATFHYKKIVNGKKSEINLCNECALEMGYVTSFNDPFDFGSTLNDFLGITNSPKSVTCPSCGMNHTTFKKTGRLGCEKCYEHFKSTIDEILPSIQPGKVHKGKHTGESNEEFLKKKRLKELKENLQKAILDERYEDAAKFRDEIKKEEENL